jgi:hypothetical protein
MSSATVPSRFEIALIWLRGSKVKFLHIAALTSTIWSFASQAGEPSHSLVDGSSADVPWQQAWVQPWRLRSYCSFDVTQGRCYCPDHCGSDYEFYYCSQKSFGCCHIGGGYCNWDGLLRCRP